jgi:hypothetical protein
MSAFTARAPPVHARRSEWSAWVRRWFTFEESIEPEAKNPNVEHGWENGQVLAIAGRKPEHAQRAAAWRTLERPI